MKDTQLKVLSWINVIWVGIAAISILTGESDSSTVWSLVFCALVIWQSIRALTLLK